MDRCGTGPMSCTSTSASSARVRSGRRSPFCGTDELAESAVPPAPHPPDDGPRLRDANVPTLGRQRTLEGADSAGRPGRDAAAPGSCWERLTTNYRGCWRASRWPSTPLALAFCGGLGYLLARAALPRPHRAPPPRKLQEATAERLDRKRLSVANPDDELGRADQDDQRDDRPAGSEDPSRKSAGSRPTPRTNCGRRWRQSARRGRGRPGQLRRSRRSRSGSWAACWRSAFVWHGLIDRLLALSREDAGVTRSVREPVDLVGALVGAVAENTAAAGRGALKLTLHVQGRQGNVEVRGDGAAAAAGFSTTCSTMPSR